MIEPVKIHSQCRYIVSKTLAHYVSIQIKLDILRALRDDLRDGRVPHFAQALQLLQLIGGVCELPGYCISEVLTSATANQIQNHILLGLQHSG